MNAYLLAGMAFMPVYMDVHISTCAHMCEINIKDISSCVHVYMQMGIYSTICLCVYIYVYMCGSVYVFICIMCIHRCICI